MDVGTAYVYCRTVYGLRALQILYPRYPPPGEPRSSGMAMFDPTLWYVGRTVKDLERGISVRRHVRPPVSFATILTGWGGRDIVLNILSDILTHSHRRKKYIAYVGPECV